MINHEYVINSGRSEILNLDLTSGIEGKVEIPIQLRKTKSKYKNDDASKCSYCGFIAAYPWHIRDHVRRCHTFERPHKCTVCTKAFVTALELKRHSYRHTGEKPFGCQYCNRSFAHRSLRNEHEDSHGINRHKCRHCDMLFFSRRERISHEKAMHRMANEHQCEKCYKVFANVRCLELHKVKTNNHEKYSCEICNEKFPSKSTYYSHKRIHRNEPVQYRRPRRSKSKALDSTSTNNKPGAFIPQNCNFCSVFFSHRKEYHNHLEIYHPREKDQILCFVCEQCGKRFDESHLLISHRNYVHKEKNVSCPKCNYKCRKNQEMDKHLRKHMKTFLYKRVDNSKDAHSKDSGQYIEFSSQCCRFCSECFTLRDEYHSHLQEVHPDVAYQVLCFRCELCDKLFDDYHLLQHHKDIGHREKRMICNQCNYKCHKKQAMDLHLLTHLAEASFLCETCGKAYRSKKGLKTHSLSHLEKPHSEKEIIDIRYETNFVPSISQNYNSSNYLPKTEKKSPIKIGIKDILKKKHLCSVCPMKFSCKYSLEKHLSESHRDEIENCKTCIKSNFSIGDLLHHMEDHPKVVDCSQRIYECFACGLLFDTEACHSKHLQSHRID